MTGMVALAGADTPRETAGFPGHLAIALMVLLVAPLAHHWGRLTARSTAAGPKPRPRDAPASARP